MAIKRTNGNGTSANGDQPTPDGASHTNGSESQKFRENAEVNAKIDAYIQQNPKEWAYVQSMPRDRLERSLVLQSVQKQERTARIRASVLRKLEQNPELKQAYQTLVKNLPAEQQEKAIASLAMRTRQTVAPPAPQQTQVARV